MRSQPITVTRTIREPSHHQQGEALEEEGEAQLASG